MKKFYSNFGKMAVGVGGAQLLGWATIPMLTRFYTPSDWGAFGLLLSVASVIGILSTLRYEFALFLPRSERHAQRIVTLCLLLSGVFFIFNMSLILIYQQELEELVFGKNVGNWCLFLPFLGLMICWTNIFSNSVSRQSKFTVLSLSLAFQQFSNFLVSLILGVFSLGFLGLLLGKIMGLLVCFWFLSYPIVTFFNDIKNKTACLMLLALAKKYKRFPVYSLSNSLLSLLSKDGILFIMAFLGDTKALGVLVLVRAMIFAPASLVSSVLGPIFLKEFSLNEISGFSNRRALYFYLLILVTGLPLYLYVGLNAEFLISYFLGALWSGSGTIFRYLLPVGFLLLYTSWIDRIFEIKQKTDWALFIQILFDLVMLSTIAVFSIMNFSIEAIYISYAVVLFAHNLVYLTVASVLIFKR